MRFRSSDHEFHEITLGVALALLCNPKFVPLQTSTRWRLNFENREEGGWISIQGIYQETEILCALYLLIGPETPRLIFESIPPEFHDLRARNRNPTAYREGIIHALALNGVDVPEPYRHAQIFRRWLRELEIYY